MRKWAYLKPEEESVNGFPYRKIMLYASDEGVFVFLYESAESVFCSADEFYEDEEDALEAWEDRIDARGWQEIADPLPGCQHDSILPIRVKGRDSGSPQWGKYEILIDGEWSDFKMP